MDAASNKVFFRIRDTINKKPTRVLSRIPAAFLRGALFLQTFLYLTVSLFSADDWKEANVTLGMGFKKVIKTKKSLLMDQTVTKWRI